MDRPVLFPLLKDPQAYQPCHIVLEPRSERRRYWLALFRGHFSKLLEAGIEEAVESGLGRHDAVDRAARAEAALGAVLDAHEDGDGHLDILTLCRERQAVLEAHGFDDPYRAIKRRETEAALRLLPEALRELDAQSPARRAERVVQGVFAGNIFDLGATEALSLLAQGGGDFYSTRGALKPRPWLVDDLDAWLARLATRPPRAAVVFVDNAGSDVVLGMLPFARDLLGHGSVVILAANSKPALNDITHAELLDVLSRAAAVDDRLRAALAAERLRAVASGGDTPLLDFRAIAEPLVTAVESAPVDLVVLEGMGRALESNYRALFDCDVLKVAMLKDPDVGSWFGGGTYDLVLRYEPASR